MASPRPGSRIFAVDAARTTDNETTKRGEGLTALSEAFRELDASLEKFARDR